MVANRIMVGNEEKFSVSAVLRATIMISSASKMLRVKKKSNISGGKGNINMVKMRMTAIGIANEVHGTVADNCRKSDRLIAEVAITAA